MSRRGWPPIGRPPGLGLASGPEEKGSSNGSGGTPGNPRNQGPIDVEPYVLVRHVVGRELALDLGAPDDARQLDLARDLPFGARRRILLGRRHPASIEQHDLAVVGADRSDDLDADLVLAAARAEIEFLVVQEGARELYAPILESRRIVRQQSVQRNRRGSLILRDALKEIELPFAALHLPDAEAQREDEDR